MKRVSVSESFYFTFIKAGLQSGTRRHIYSMLNRCICLHINTCSISCVEARNRNIIDKYFHKVNDKHFVPFTHNGRVAMQCHQEQFQVQYLAQGHLSVDGAELPILWTLALSPEALPSSMLKTNYQTTKINCSVLEEYVLLAATLHGTRRQRRRVNE